MGKNPPPQSSESGLMKTSKAKLKMALNFVVISAFCFLFFSPAYAQTNLESLAEHINRGNSEQKRAALFQIRNVKTAESSRAAIPALQDKNEIVRATAASSVVFLPSAEAFAVLLPLLRDKKPFVRKEAAYALGKIRNFAAILPLVEIIQKDKIQEVKDAATFALGEIGDVSAVDALIQILKRRPQDKEEFMRRSAARSLGEIANNQVLQRSLQRVENSPVSLADFADETRANLSNEIPAFRNAVNLLIQILQAPAETDDVKREAAYALGEIGDVSAIPVLQSKLSVEDYYLAEICRKSLQKLQTVPK
jgi:HEAT repeat protein